LPISSQAKRYEGGSLVIARLAPQDYHRFHMPVGGTLRPFTPIDGTYFTVPSSPRPGLCAISSGRLTKYVTYESTQVNPVAVNTSVDVYTENKRVVCPVDSDEFGLVTFVAIGATMVRHHSTGTRTTAHTPVMNLLPKIVSQVGSICFTTTPGQTIKKGDEHGYFGAHPPPPPARHVRSVCACAVRT
jgi:phosphatidylserine decarboxylase